MVCRALDLHARLDELFLALEERSDALVESIPTAEPLGTMQTTDSEASDKGQNDVFSVLMLGDSTMRVRQIFCPGGAA